MLVVRDIFQLHFGKAREALELLKQIKPHMEKEVQDPEWRACYAKFSLLCHSGKREVLRVTV